jgi:2,3-bisphosphoglycerate-dependent phosphoglycerate mutase
MSDPSASQGAGRRHGPLALAMMRHGESTWNSARLVQGQNDESVLTEVGVGQVRDAALTLLGRVDVIVTSDLARALQSARVAAQVLGVEVHVDPDWRERSYGVLEGGSLDAVSAELVGVSGGVILDEDAHPEGGESLRELAARCVRAARRAAARSEDGRALVLTHGGPIRMVRAAAEGRRLVGCAWDAVGNASLWPVSLRPEQGARAR